MNQTVTINISGIVYHIEIDAYDTLKNYLQKIKSFFNNSEEREEIIQDIEARIAELFNEGLTSKNQVITAQNVANVIEIMGKPEQYLTDENEEDFSSNYEEVKTNKKLFRNTDERILGGVSSGLAAYVGIDTVWIRLFFVAALFMGFGILTYIILWIVIPAAKTASDKLKMKGEPINFKNIGKKIEDEATNVNEKLKKMDTNNFFSKLGVVIERFANAFAGLFTSIFTILGKVVGVGLLIVGTTALLVFILAIFGSSSIISITSNGFLSVETYDLLNLVFQSEDDLFIGVTGVLLIVGIPLVAIILLAIKILFKIKTHYSVGLSLVGLFILGTIFCSWTGIRTGKAFSSRKTVVKTENLPLNFTSLVIKTTTSDFKGKSLLEDNQNLISVDENLFYMRTVNFTVKKSPNDSLFIETKLMAHGNNHKNALFNAKSINYNYVINDSTLFLDAYLSTLKAIKLRNQQVYLTLYLPLNKVIYIDETAKDVIYDVDNVTNTYDKNMTGKKWVMLEQGLTCLDCEAIEGITQQQLDSTMNNKELIIDEKSN